MPVLQTTGKYMALIYHNKHRMGFGSFETKERADIAERIARYWSKKGMNPPSVNRTIDAI